MKQSYYYFLFYFIFNKDASRFTKISSIHMRLVRRTKARSLTQGGAGPRCGAVSRSSGAELQQILVGDNITWT